MSKDNLVISKEIGEILANVRSIKSFLNIEKNDDFLRINAAFLSSEELFKYLIFILLLR